MKKKYFFIGLILFCSFLFFTPSVRSENEIIGIYPEEDNSINPRWDGDGLLIDDGYRADGDSWIYLGNSYHIDETILRIIYLKFGIPNSTKDIKSMKLRLYQSHRQNYLYENESMPIKTELVSNNWSASYLTWLNKPESMGISTLTEWTDIAVYYYKYIELVSFVDYIENGTMSISIESLLNGSYYIGFWAMEYSDINKIPTLIIEYKEEPEEPIPPNPFTLTSNADNPDTDGLFTLYWIVSENADNYSIYQDDILLNSGWTHTEYYIQINLDGYYNFTVIAFNIYGNTSSNEITVFVEIPPPPKPSPFILTSDANNPDMDGIFTLSWSVSQYADTYSIYQDEILVDNKLTTLQYDIRIYVDGSYNFKVVAINDYGNMSSNEIPINIEIPLPSPSPFMLTSNADDPDEDGIFMLYWSESEYAEVYSVYCDGELLKWGITNLYCNIKVYTSGNYNFKVVALNDYGQVDSNIIIVNVDIYIVEPEPEDPEEPIRIMLLGYQIATIILSSCLATVSVVFIWKYIYRVKLKRQA